MTAETASSVNEQMPYYVASRIMEALNASGKSLNGARVLVLGASYKKDVSDIRESPSLKLIQLLLEKGANLSYHDPYIERIQIAAEILPSVELTDEALSSADCVVIATDHSCYDYQNIVNGASLVFDTRGATGRLQGNNIVRL